MIKKLIKFIGLAMFLFIVYSGYEIWTYQKINELSETDAAIVLGAAAYHNKPSPVFKERIDHGIKLYKEGVVKKLIFTGGKSEGAAFAESEVAKFYAINQGVPESAIHIETKSLITEENLYYAKEIGTQLGFKTYTLVSDPLHMKRAIYLAEEIGMEVLSSPTQTSAYQTFQTKLPFFLRELVFYLGYKIVTFIDHGTFIHKFGVSPPSY